MVRNKKRKEKFSAELILQGKSSIGRKAHSHWDTTSLAGRSARKEAELPRFGGDSGNCMAGRTGEN